MSNSIEKLANLFNERNNSTHVNVTTGIVLSTTPLRIKWGDNVLLEEKSLVVASIIKTGLVVVNISDKVIMMPDNDFKKWYIIDKVG